MNKQNTKLLPYRSYDENDVINEFSLDRHSEYGDFVKISRGDLDDLEGQIADDFGASYDRVTSPFWGVTNKITLTTSGDTKYDVLGVTLMSTLQYDENGEQLKFNKQKRHELFAVLTGQAVPVVGKGRFTLGHDGYLVAGVTPDAGAGTQGNIGDVIVPSNSVDGKVDCVPTSAIVASPTSATEYGEDQILGKVLATGTYGDGSLYVSMNV